MKNVKFLIISCLLFMCVGCGNDNNNDNNNKYLTGKHKVIMKIEDYGDIELELDADVAPITVTNFINLVKDKFYDGTKFHRIIEGFMIQGGESNTGETKATIKGEFAKNGVENNISHRRGVISMARNGLSYDSASTQFFIVHKDSLFLDGDYAGFGRVTKGIAVVDKIAEAANPIDDNGSIDESEQPIITSIRVIKDKK